MRQGRTVNNCQLTTVNSQRGATLLDVVVGSALMTLVFVGIVGAFKLSVEAVSNNKARAGAIALTNERLEYIRSLPYDAIGTVGGIPAGLMEQTATSTLNDVLYTRRTFVSYEDDPGDGTGAADTNGIVVDYKAAKVDVSWQSKQGTRTLTMATRISPPTGMEQDLPGGTIIIHAVDAEFQPIQSAQVRIANSTVNPAIDLTTFTDELGTASVLGAPPAGGYAITVTKGGYSSAQTYGVTATNTNPIPAHLGVGGYQTTAATFEIDRLSSLHVETYEKIKDESWDDLFTDDSNVSLTDVEITGGRAELAGSEGSYAASGTVISIAPSIPYLYRWQEITWNDIVPGGTDIVYRVYDAGGEPLSNGELQGNTAGFTSPPINISGVSTSTHALLKVGATLATSDASTTPSIQDWTVSYEVGPEPLSDIDFNLHGGKTIGTEAGGSLIYKYDVDHTTNAEGLRDISNIEWDLYTISVSASTGYDIASSCPPQSVGIVPEAAVSVRLYLAAHTTNSLLVDVRASDGTLIDGASIRLYRGSYDTTLTSDECGQEIFSSLSVGSVGAGNPYSIEVSASGYTSYTSTEVNVSGTTRLSIILN